MNRLSTRGFAASRYNRLVTAFGAALISGAAMADSTIDVSSVTAQIAAAAVAVLAIGTAVVAGPAIAVKVYKWVKAAL